MKKSNCKINYSNSSDTEFWERPRKTNHDDYLEALVTELDYNEERRNLIMPVSYGYGGVSSVELIGSILGSSPRIIANVYYAIDKVIYNDPATIILWTDGSKTVVKCQEGDTYDPEKGLAMGIIKKVFGNTGNYYNIFKKFLPKESDDSIKQSTQLENILTRLKNVSSFMMDVESLAEWDRNRTIPSRDLYEKGEGNE